MELIVPLNAQGGRPLYEQIYQYIKDEIRKGNIRPEKQLPSSRELAKSLKVSRSTTQLAYEQLVSEGYLEAVPRRLFCGVTGRNLSAGGAVCCCPAGSEKRAVFGHGKGKCPGAAFS